MQGCGYGRGERQPWKQESCPRCPMLEQRKHGVHNQSQSKMDYVSARHVEKVEGVLKNFSGQGSQCVSEEILNSY